jgi:hypothetical protein
VFCALLGQDLGACQLTSEQLPHQRWIEIPIARQKDVFRTAATVPATTIWLQALTSAPDPSGLMWRMLLPRNWNAG